MTAPQTPTPSQDSGSGELRPVAWISPGQFVNLKPDPDDAGGAGYLPIRHTKAGNFTQPLYATPKTPPAASSGQDLREAFKAGWRTNAVGEETHPASYLDSAEQVDWEVYQRSGISKYLADLAQGAREAEEEAALISAPAVQPGGDLVVQELTALVASQQRLLQAVLAAIDTGRSEPLFIVRDQLRNFLADHAPETIGAAISSEKARV